MAFVAQPITRATLAPGKYIRAYVNTSGECSFHTIFVIGEVFERFANHRDDYLPSVMTQYRKQSEPYPYYLSDLGCGDSDHVRLYAYADDVEQQLRTMVEEGGTTDNRLFTELIHGRTYSDHDWQEQCITYRMMRYLDRLIDDSILT
jgi:hypothetical protein